MTHFSPLRVRAVLTSTLDGSRAHFLFCLKVSSGDFSFRQKNHLSFIVSYTSHCVPVTFHRTLRQGGAKRGQKDSYCGPTAVTSVSSVRVFTRYDSEPRLPGQEHPIRERKCSGDAIPPGEAPTTAALSAPLTRQARVTSPVPQAAAPQAAPS